MVQDEKAMFKVFQQMMKSNPQMVQQMMSQASGGGGKKGAGNAAGKQPAGGPATDINWKGELGTAFSKDRKTAATKQTVVYSAEEVDHASGKMYQATVSVEGVKFKSKLMPGKKQSEQEAAKLAVKKLFPQHKVTGETANTKASKAAAVAPDNGKKRKAQEAFPTHVEHPKTKLFDALNILWGRMLKKEDYSLEVMEADGQYTATLTFPQKQLAFRGQTLDSKKAADASVCEVALQEMSAEIDAGLAEHAERKKIKNQESVKALKERTAAKKAEKKAAAEGGLV